MTQEEKELLFQYLSMALPYGLIVDPIDCGPAKLIGIEGCDALLYDLIHEKKYDKPWDIEYIKPYLRPMSSMTDEEKEKYYTFQYKFTLYTYEHQELNKETFSEYLNWLLENHFDYNELISKNLAIDCTGLNIY